jgi:hypothetical protein
MKRLISVVIVGLCLAFVASPAGASAWQANGGGCVPTDQTVRDDAWWVVTGGGRVKHKGSSLADIRLVCPVSQLSRPASTIRLYYQDTDGAGPQLQVTASVRQFHKTNGHLSTPCAIWSQQAGAWRFTDNPACGAIDLDSHLVWIEVLIHRGTTNGLVEFNGVELR